MDGRRSTVDNRGRFSADNPNLSQPFSGRRFAAFRGDGKRSVRRVAVRNRAGSRREIRTGPGAGRGSASAVRGRVPRGRTRSRGKRRKLSTRRPCAGDKIWRFIGVLFRRLSRGRNAIMADIRAICTRAGSRPERSLSRSSVPASKRRRSRRNKRIVVSRRSRLRLSRDRRGIPRSVWAP